ncbi:formimidoylglutamase [Sulfurospirillum sp. 1307]
MYKKPIKDLWSGRVDKNDGDLGLRFHQKIKFLDFPYNSAKKGICILGFSCDEGINLNLGRVGAKEGPDELKKALGSLAWHFDDLNLYDCGNVVYKDDLLTSQKELALHVEYILKNSHFPIIIGGGHEVALGSFLGMFNALENKEDIAIINFDAHFDLREAKSSTSGTPFNQIALTCKNQNIDFNYMVLGISKASNTKALFKRANDLHVRYILDKEINYLNLIDTIEKIDTFLEGKRYIYISIDCDVFCSNQVPSVSAMASRGIEFGLVLDILNHLFSKYSDKIKLLDIAEFSPKYDINDLGKKHISRLVFDLVELFHHNVICRK